MTDAMETTHWWTQEWWGRIPAAYQEADAAASPQVGNYPLLRFMDGPGRVAGEVRDLSDQMWSGDFMMPETAPDYALRWLAQLLGVSLAQRALSPADLRQYLLDISGQGRPAVGNRQSIADAARRFLTGDKQVSIQPNILRTQWATNPEPSNVNGWNYSNTAYVKTWEPAVWGRPAMVFTRAATGASASLWAGRNIGTLGTASAPPFDVATLTPVVPGDVVTARLAVGTDKLNATGYLRISWLDSAGNKTTTPASSQATPVAITQNGWTDLFHTATAPAGAAFVEIETGVDLTTGVTVGGERVWAGRAYIGVNDPGNYYSGATTPPAGMTLTWNGTAGASTSKMTTTPHTIIVLVRTDQLEGSTLAALVAGIKSTGVVPAGHDLQAQFAVATWDSYEAAVGTWDAADASQRTWAGADAVGITLT